MQPQQPSSPPNPQYDFIMSDGQKPKRNLLPKLELPKPVKLGLFAAVGLIIAIIVSSLVFGNKGGGNNPVVDIMAQAQEIARVSDLVEQESEDSGAQALASTVSTVLNSQETQLSSYLSSIGQKPSTKTLAADQNSSIDTQLQVAAQNNNLESTYNSYLSQQLNSYKSSLATEYNKTSSAKLKALLSTADASAQTILDSL